MTLTWDAVTAISTAASAVVVAGTVIVGVRQIAHLRRATQLEGITELFAEHASEEHTATLRFIMHELDARMEDVSYRSEIGDPWSVLTHPEIAYLRRMERFGVIVRYGLLEPEPLLDIMTPTYLHAWEKLVSAGVIEEQRRARGPRQWRNAEWLYERAKRFYEKAASSRG